MPICDDFENRLLAVLLIIYNSSGFASCWCNVLLFAHPYDKVRKLVQVVCFRDPLIKKDNSKNSLLALVKGLSAINVSTATFLKVKLI